MVSPISFLDEKPATRGQAVTFRAIADGTLPR